MRKGKQEKIQTAKATYNQQGFNVFEVYKML